VEQVLGHVPLAERCQCSEQASAAPAKSGGFFSFLKR
jgi:hypothetical protein